MRLLSFLIGVLCVAAAVAAEEAIPAKPAVVTAAWPESWRKVYRRVESLQKSLLEFAPSSQTKLEAVAVTRIIQKGELFYQNGILNGSVAAFQPSKYVQGEPCELVACQRRSTGSSRGDFCYPQAARISGLLNANSEFGEDAKISWLTQPEENHWPDAMEFATQNYMAAYEKTDVQRPESDTLGIQVDHSYKVALWENDQALTTFGLSKFKHPEWEPRRFVPAQGVQLRVSSPTAQYHALVNWHLFRNGVLLRKLPVSGNEFITLPKEVGQYVAMIIAPAPRGGLRVSNYVPWQMRD